MNPANLSSSSTSSTSSTSIVPAGPNAAALTLLAANPVAAGVLSTLVHSAIAQIALQSLQATTLPSSKPWRAVTDPYAVVGGFKEIRLVADTFLSPEEIERAAGCLGYALTETVKGNELSDPRTAYPTDGSVTFTVLEFDWDSDDCIRTSPDFNRAFEVAGVYVFHGSKIRTTNLAGPNTRGTQLVKGIGPGRCNMQFFVR